MRGFCEIFDFFCLVLLRENHSDAAQSVDHPVDDLIKFDVVLNQHAATCWKVGFAFQQIFPACTPSSFFPTNPSLRPSSTDPRIAGAFEVQGFLVGLLVFSLADPIDPQCIVNSDVIVRVLFDGLVDECRSPLPVAEKGHQIAEILKN
jgi:hypothetical protein